MTDSLRAKQNMEILDVFKDLHSQVVGLQNKQVQQFSESLKAKTQRDLGAEVNVDKAVENINRIIESKLGALEFVVQNIAESNRGGDKDLATAANRTIFYNSLSQVNNSGDVIPLYNSIVRAYQEPGVSRETQQIIKVKVQELTPNLDAVCYGLNQAIDTIFEKRILNPSIARVILDLLRTLSVYTELKAQVESNPPRFEMFNVELLDRVFKNIFESQSTDRLTVLKEYAPRGLLVSATIRNIPDFKTGDIEERIKAIQEELGLRLPQATIDKLRGLSSADLTNAVNELKANILPAHKTKLKQEQVGTLQRIQELANRIRELETDIAEGRQRMDAIDDLANKLEHERPYDEMEAEFQYIEAEDPGDEPIAPALADLWYVEDTDEYARIIDEFNREYDEWTIAYSNFRAAQDHNEAIQMQLMQSQAEREQAIINLRREFDLLYRADRRFVDELREALRESDELKRVVSDPQLIRLKPVIRALFPDEKVQKLKAQSKERARELNPFGQAEARVLGRGQGEETGCAKPVDKRGLSGINNNYGRKDVSVIKSDNMDFDDCGNDSYA